MRILTVDLASKFSAVVVRDTGGEILRQFDSSGKSSFAFCAEVARTAIELEVDLVLVEDVPYGISSQAMVKPVLRLQGILITMLHKVQCPILFLNPSTWQTAYPGVAKAPKDLTKSQKDAYRIEAARKHAEDRGYTPPDLVAEYAASLPEGTKVLKKHTNPLEKQMTDYVDAALMAIWAQEQGSVEQIQSLKGVQPFFI